MYRGPGPSVRMPGLIGRKDHDPRSTHRMMPECPIGLLCPLKVTTVGPGPAYWLDSMYKDGKYMPPELTILIKLNDLNPVLTPGPAAYGPEYHMHISFPRAPAWSMAARFGTEHPSTTPGIYAMVIEEFRCNNDE